VPYGYAVFTATFKGVSTTGGIDLNTLKPATQAGVVLVGDSKVKIFVLDEGGNYGTPIVWYGTKGYWSKDNGATKIPDGEVVIENGEGFALNNGLKTLDGVESTNRKAVESPAVLTVSGEVDLVCSNVVPYGYSINGNSTPVAFDLRNVIPQTPSCITITGDSKVKIYTLGLDGNYGAPIVWYGSKGYWSQDNGATEIKETILKPGEGFALNNGLKTLDGVESTNRKAVESSAVLKLPAPIK
jgi:hypothetical protein